MHPFRNIIPNRSEQPDAPENGEQQQQPNVNPQNNIANSAQRLAGHLMLQFGANDHQPRLNRDSSRGSFEIIRNNAHQDTEQAHTQGSSSGASQPIGQPFSHADEPNSGEGSSSRSREVSNTDGNMTSAEILDLSKQLLAHLIQLNHQPGQQRASGSDALQNNQQPFHPLRRQQPNPQGLRQVQNAQQPSSAGPSRALAHATPIDPKLAAALDRLRYENCDIRSPIQDFRLDWEKDHELIELPWQAVPGASQGDKLGLSNYLRSCRTLGIADNLEGIKYIETVRDQLPDGLYCMDGLLSKLLDELKVKTVDDSVMRQYVQPLKQILRIHASQQSEATKEELGVIIGNIVEDADTACGDRAGFYLLQANAACMIFLIEKCVDKSFFDYFNDLDKVIWNIGISNYKVHCLEKLVNALFLRNAEQSRLINSVHSFYDAYYHLQDEFNLPVRLPRPMYGENTGTLSKAFAQETIRPALIELLEKSQPIGPDDTGRMIEFMAKWSPWKNRIDMLKTGRKEAFEQSKERQYKRMEALTDRFEKGELTEQSYKKKMDDTKLGYEKFIQRGYEGFTYEFYVIARANCYEDLTQIQRV